MDLVKNQRFGFLPNKSSTKKDSDEALKYKYICFQNAILYSHEGFVQCLVWQNPLEKITSDTQLQR